MDYKSNYTFSNKYNNSLDNIFSEQNSRLINNNTNINYKNMTNNYLNISYFNNNQTMTNYNNNPINNNNNINNVNNINNSFISDNHIIPDNKIISENIDENYQNINKFKEEFAKIKKIIKNDPSPNPNLQTQDCFDLYRYPFITPGDNYAFSQFNNAFKQKYLMKTLFDNKYIYINGKQYHRIMKRREVRKKIKESLQINKNKVDKNKKYHHESRHRHAMNRERGKGGRFVSKKKLEMDNKNKNDSNEDKENEENDDKRNTNVNDKNEKGKIKK